MGQIPQSGKKSVLNPHFILFFLHCIVVGKTRVTNMFIKCSEFAGHKQKQVMVAKGKKGCSWFLFRPTNNLVLRYFQMYGTTQTFSWGGSRWSGLHRRVDPKTCTLSTKGEIYV